MHVVTIYDGNMNRINTHFTGSKPTFEQLADFKNRYENAEYVESNERFADFEIREGERKERLADEEKKAELEWKTEFHYPSRLLLLRFPHSLMI
ncbi:hypothetical protein N3930_43040, partial [Bacillus thuringiensis]|nr:hypothetical protein [Bacillus thuringiensis]